LNIKNKAIRKVWEQQLDDLFEKKSKEDIDFIWNIINLRLIDYNKDMLELIRLVGLETFSKIINLFDGKRVQFLRVSEMKEELMLALFYFYKEKQSLSWDQIREKVPFDVNSIKYGIKITKTSKLIKEKIKDIFKSWEIFKNEKL
jgi:hypothetical protein